MYFGSIEDDHLLKNCNSIWNKVSNSNEKEFDSEPIYNIFFLKTKLKPEYYKSIDLDDKEIPKVGSNYTFLTARIIDFILEMIKTIICKCFQKIPNTKKKKK